MLIFCISFALRYVDLSNKPEKVIKDIPSKKKRLLGEWECPSHIWSALFEKTSILLVCNFKTYGKLSKKNCQHRQNYILCVCHYFSHFFVLLLLRKLWLWEYRHFYTFFYKYYSTWAQAQMLSNKSQILWKMALPYQTKRCLECYLELVHSFWNGLIIHISLFSGIRVSHLSTRRLKNRWKRIIGR